MFDIGEEVVCIDDSMTCRSGRRELKLGTHYHIRWIGMYQHAGHSDATLCVRLEEFRRDESEDLIAALNVLRDALKEMEVDVPIPELRDIPFRATRFAPLRKAKTDISAFENLLVVQEKVLEDV